MGPNDSQGAADQAFVTRNRYGRARMTQKELGLHFFTHYCTDGTQRVRYERASVGSDDSKETAIDLFSTYRYRRVPTREKGLQVTFNERFRYGWDSEGLYGSNRPADGFCL